MTTEHTPTPWDAKPFVVTGFAWNPVTRKHDLPVSQAFHREYEASAFININREWIATLRLANGEG